MTTYPVPDEALELRLTATGADEIERTATAFILAADELESQLTRLRNVPTGLENSWSGPAAHAARNLVTRDVAVLLRMPEVFREIGRHLRSHAAVTDDAQRSLARASVDAYMQRSLGSALDLASVRDAAVADFHASEIAARTALWDLGAEAPGGIPLPGAPQPGSVSLPPPSPWQLPWYPDQWAWDDGTDRPVTGNGELPPAWDATEPLYGLDEDLNRVPAYEAAIPGPVLLHENGVSRVGPLLRHLIGSGARATPATGTGVRAIAHTEDELRGIVTSSWGWRESHIDKKVRQFYNVRGKEPLAPWMKKEFLDLIVKSGSTNERVFVWSTKGPEGRVMTQAVLTRDHSTKRMLMHQYYAEGQRAGEFVNALIPNPRQYTSMMQAKVVEP